MSPLIMTLLLLAPGSREPVGQGAWRKHKDPIVRRLASTTLGEPIRVKFVTVIPMFARVPSEAGHGRSDGPVWVDSACRAKSLVEDKRVYLRAGNDGARPLFLPAGTVYRTHDSELFVARDAVVSAEFSALLPGAWNKSSARHVSSGELVGVLPPLAVGLLLHPKGDASGWVHRLRILPRTPWYGEAIEARSVRTLTVRLEVACRPLSNEFSRTAVGAVFLIAGDPVVAHVFSTNELFVGALPDLLAGVAVQARHLQFAYRQERASISARLSRLAAKKAERVAALSFLRSVQEMRGVWSESYGEGQERLLQDRIHRTVGHGVIDQRRTVVHFGLYALGNMWPGRRGPAARPTPGPGPDDGSSETSPGEIDRRARPAIGEQRQRDRKPVPNSTGGGAGRGR